MSDEKGKSASPKPRHRKVGDQLTRRQSTVKGLLGDINPMLNRRRSSVSAASVAASAGGPDSKRIKFTIWPEWNDADINAEKWEAPRKDDRKGKSPTVVQHYYDDPDGKIEMPPSLKVNHWKRPHDIIFDKAPVIFDPEQVGNGFDLVSCNDHISESELIRYIISQITALWEMNTAKAPEKADTGLSVPDDMPQHTWKPWEHIYSLCKAGKGPHQPMYNPHGKYVVRLYWMGCWRKIYVDDSLPYDDEDRLLLPCSNIQEELWPMLLSKALIKVASLDYSGGSNSCEFGDCSIIQCLTGWLPEAIPLQYGHITEIWNLLKDFLPVWQLPIQEADKTEAPDAMKKELSNSVDSQKEEKSEKETLPKDTKPEGKEKAKDGVKEKPAKDAKDKEKGKDGKEEKKEKKEKDKGDKEKDKDKHREKSLVEEPVIPENPEVVVFATYSSTPKYPVAVSVLGEHADASEHLRKTGLSHLFPHPVWITQTRDIPLEPPPVPEVIPAWKLIRPRIKKEPPSDEARVEPEPPKPIQCLEIASPYVNYKVSPMPIPTETCRPSSSLSRHGTRSRPNTAAIAESDETTNDPEVLFGGSLDYDKVDLPIIGGCTTKHEGELPHEEVPISPKSQQSSGGKEKDKDKDKKKIEGKKETKEKDPPEHSPKPNRRGSKASSKDKPHSGKSDKTKDDVKKEKEKTKEKGDKKELTGALKSLHPPQNSPQHSQHPGQHPESISAQIPSEVQDMLLDEELDDLKIDPELANLEDSEPPKPKKIWVDFDQFSRCFKTLYIFHKPNTYLCNQKFSDLKDNVSSPQNVQPVGVPTTGKTDKKPGTATTGVIQSSMKISHPPSYFQNTPPTNLLSHLGADDRSPHYLFVDSLKSTEIVVSFTSLPRWFEPMPLIEDKKSHTTLKSKEKEKDDKNKEKDKDVEKEPTGLTCSSLLEEEQHEGSIGREPVSTPVTVTPGTLVAEPYSWKSLITGQPVLHLRTSSTRAAVLSLPAGRHVLRFMMNSPLGYHIHLCSATQFVFGDEETVMAQLVNESCRFRDNAVQVIHNLGKCINALSEPNPECFQQAWEELVESHCPYRKDKLMSKQHHFKVFNDALYTTLKKSLHEIICPELSFAFRALLFDATTPNILGINSGSRPATGSVASQRGSAKVGSKGKQAPPEGEPEKTENTWVNREPTPEEHVATVKLQKAWRGTWIRNMKSARIAGTEENIKVVEQLQKAWAIIEPSAEEIGLFLFREMFKHYPEIMAKYPFHQDEWNKISYSDYRGNYPEQVSSNWFLVFREIFYVKEEMLAVPKLYVPINTCLLRVVNNDTGEEIPKVFQKVAPYVYKKNKKGYTFVAEARTLEQPLVGGNWRMRMIGSLSPLPAPRNVEVNSAFHAREIRDYFLPNTKNIIFRYTVKVTEDHLASLQVNTSKHDVYIKLQILDHDEEVISGIGKGHIVIPAFIFQKDYNPEEIETKRSSSRSSNRGDKKISAASVVKGKRSGSAKSEGRNSRSSDHTVSDEPDERDTKPHKYIVQATVLKNSWPLSESSWAFVQMLKEVEKNELKVAYKERPPSPPKEKAPPPSSQKGKGGGKGGKADKGGKDKDKGGTGSRPASQQFDITKPHWTLRVVSDQIAAEEIEVKKDTERADEIRAMKKAWEDAEPGRAAKALQSRLQYLSTHMIKVETEEEPKEESAVEEQPAEIDVVPHPGTPISSPDQPETEIILTLEPPPPQLKEYLQPFDVTPFIKKTRDTYIYLDEEEMKRRLEERQREIQNYKHFREGVERWREEDKIGRNLAKIRQLDKCEELQAALDAIRDSVNTPREAFRQKYLEAERIRLEELAAQMAALKAEQEAKSPKGRKSAKGKKSASGKKKK